MWRENRGLASESMMAAHELAAQQLALRVLVHHQGREGFTKDTKGPGTSAAIFRETQSIDGGQGPAKGATSYSRRVLRALLCGLGDAPASQVYTVF